MPEPIDYASPDTRRRSPLLAHLATASLLFPLVIAATFYGEWLLAWQALGHKPRPSLDDPKLIGGSNWMHDLSALAISGAIPAALISFALNLVLVGAHRPATQRLKVRLAVLGLSWLTLLLLFSLDPGRVLYWWLD
jgi:hypothetical protein